MIERLPTDELTDRQFAEISVLVKRLCGINLHEGKRALVRSRLTKRLRQLRIPSFERYMEILSADKSGRELVALLDLLSTNLTRFFRESAHFDLLVERIRKDCAGAGRPSLRLWSAGCSTGEEPYSLAISLFEGFEDFERWDARLLATDLSTEALATAREGLYDAQRLAEVDPDIVSRHFRPAEVNGKSGYCVADHVKRVVRFARLNLMEAWPMSGPFDAILCRNVMIYFDKATQERLVTRFHEVLRPGGTLCIGHSESLTGVQHDFSYLQPTVYEKPSEQNGVYR